MLRFAPKKTESTSYIIRAEKLLQLPEADQGNAYHTIQMNETDGYISNRHIKRRNKNEV